MAMDRRGVKEMVVGGRSATSGALGLAVQRKGSAPPSGEEHRRLTVVPRSQWPPAHSAPIVPAKELSLREIAHYGLPLVSLPSEVRSWRLRNFRHLYRGLRRVLLARALGLPHFYGQLSLTVFRKGGQELPLGLASLRVVTDDGVEAIVDAFQNLFELETFRYHALGTNPQVEDAGDPGLVAELTTQYNPDDTRATGTITESAANIYRTVGTNTLDEAALLREHGIFNQASNAGGVLLDRTIFALISLSGGDSLQSTYDLTVNSGG
jgi:hypothetical protein